MPTAGNLSERVLRLAAGWGKRPENGQSGPAPGTGAPAREIPCPGAGHCSDSRWHSNHGPRTPSAWIFSPYCRKSTPQLRGELFQPESNPQSETARKLTPREIFNDFSLGILDTGNRKGPIQHPKHTRFHLFSGIQDVFSFSFFDIQNCRAASCPSF